MTALTLASILYQDAHLLHGFDRDRLAAVTRRMKEFSDRGQIAGSVILVQRRGKTVLFEANGLAQVSEKRPMRKDTIFQVMSMTKPVVAIAIVQCAEMGLLNLDDPIEKRLPQFKDLKVKLAEGNLVPVSRKPTIRQLLTHTAGFGSNDPAGLDDDTKRKLALREYGELLAKEPLIAHPGDRIAYSGPGFSTLGRIVETVSKTSLEDFCSKHIFQPLGMKDTFFFAPESRYSDIAHVYSLGNSGLEPVEENPFRKGAKFANGAGGLYSTAADMGALLTCICEGGSYRGRRILSPAAVDAMTHVQTGNLQMDGSDAQGFGLGFAVIKSPIGQTTLRPVGSFGHSGAFGTDFWADQKRGVVGVFMAQGFENVSEARKTFSTMVNAAFVGP